MFLTFSTQVASDKNDEGWWTITGLSNRKHRIMMRALEQFNRARNLILQWGLAHWGEIPFTYTPRDENGQPRLGKDGKPMIVRNDAHGLVNFCLGKVVDLTDLRFHDSYKNAARNEAAETLLSRFRLLETEEEQPKRLTGTVGEFEPRPVTEGEEDATLERVCATLINPEASQEEADQARVELAKTKRLAPILFAGSKDFRFIRHRVSRRLYVALPLMPADDEKANPIQQAGKEDLLVPLRPDGEGLPKPRWSRQWCLLPLRPHPEMEAALADSANTPRTAQLDWRERDGNWRFNVIVEVPEPEAFDPRAFLGIHISYYRLFWAVMDRDGSSMECGEIDQCNMLAIVERSRHRRFRPYGGALKLERERIVNELVALAIRHHAAIGVEDIAGVNKSTWSGKVNVRRSHWDFGRFVEVLAYKAALAGIPLVGRGKKRQPFLLNSYRARYTCGKCLRGNERGKPATITIRQAKPVEMKCSVCRHIAQVDRNSAEVIAHRCREFFLARAKRAR